ncbi:hypothetical protein F4818DRAFT_398931 [Hypoxylon cercidicola]|nr:hypothetical protein F4818DRAFT_398931 [Hypoxylon cercidicola]
MRDRPHWEFAGLAGTAGHQGGALIYNINYADGSFHSKRILKYYDANDFDEANEELKMLRMVQTQHIVRLMDSQVQAYNGTFVISEEYVGHGTLEGLFERLLAREEAGNPFRVPERFLWSVFLCFVRMLLVMKYADEDREEWEDPETVPNDGRVRPMIRHNDIYGRNVLISDLGEGEHANGPLLKLIDFGSAEIFNPKKIFNPQDGSIIEQKDDHTPDNLWQAAYVVAALAAGRFADVQPFLQTDEYAESDGSNERGNMWETITFKRIDRPGSLLHVLRRCLNDTDSIDIEQLFRICQEKVLRPNMQEYRQQYEEEEEEDIRRMSMYEEDAYIRQFIQEMVLNADVDEEIERRRRGKRFSMPMPTRAIRRASHVIERYHRSGPAHLG